MKKFVLLILTLAMIFSFAGCGEKKTLRCDHCGAGGLQGRLYGRGGSSDPRQLRIPSDRLRRQAGLQPEAPELFWPLCGLLLV